MSWESNRSATSTRMITTSMYIRLFDLTSPSSLVYPSIGCAASMVRNGNRSNFAETPTREVRGIALPSTRVDKGNKKGRGCY
jgi:hypothetical protein